MVSYTRARAEALGVECKVGHRRPRRARRDPVGRARVRARAPIVDVELLEPAVWVLAALSVITVVQRIFHVRARAAHGPPRCNADAPAGSIRPDSRSTKRDHLPNRDTTAAHP